MSQFETPTSQMEDFTATAEAAVNDINALPEPPSMYRGDNVVDILDAPSQRDTETIANVVDLTPHLDSSAPNSPNRNDVVGILAAADKESPVSAMTRRKRLGMAVTAIALAATTGFLATSDPVPGEPGFTPTQQHDDGHFDPEVISREGQTGLPGPEN